MKTFRIAYDSTIHICSFFCIFILINKEISAQRPHLEFAFNNARLTNINNNAFSTNLNRPQKGSGNLKSFGIDPSSSQQPLFITPTSAKKEVQASRPKNPQPQPEVLPVEKKTPQQKQHEIIFNVWQYAREVGPNRPVAVRPRVPTFGGASPCVAAIMSCCMTDDLRRRERCFEAHECGGNWLNKDPPCGEAMRKLVLQAIRS